MLATLTFTLNYCVRLLRLDFRLTFIYCLITALILLISVSLISGVVYRDWIVKIGWLLNFETSQVKSYRKYRWYKVAPPRLGLVKGILRLSTLMRASTLVSGVRVSVVTTLS